MKKKIKGLFSRIKGQGGFTLIELIIVIAIMGFLAAMVAPRMMGALDGGGVAVCDTNQQRLVQVTGAFAEKAGQLPNRLTNLIVKNDTGAVQDPAGAAGAWMVDDDNKATKMEIFASDLWNAARMRPHVLNTAEAAELSELGIKIAYDLNLNQGVKMYNGKDMVWNTGVPAATTHNPFMQESTVQAGVYVMMVGGTPGPVGNFAHMPAPTGTIGHPDKIYRIMMGVGPDSQLVKDGYIANTALCPNAIKRGDHFAYKHYTVVLPRLKATVDRITGSGTVSGINVTDNNTGRTVTFDLTEVGQPLQFDVYCPEGDVIIDRVLDWKVNSYTALP